MNEIERQPLQPGSDRADQVAVSDLSRLGGVWLLSPADGSAVAGPDGARCHGLGLPYPSPISAAHLHKDRVWLRVGHRCWDVDTIREVRQIAETSKRAIYELELSDGTIEKVEIRFPRDVRWMRRVDPTHDEIDSWSEDIMKLLPYVAADGWRSSNEDVASWKRRVLPLWQSGINQRA